MNETRKVRPNPELTEAMSILLGEVSGQVSAQPGDHVPAGYNSDSPANDDGETYLGDGVWANEGFGL